MDQKRINIFDIVGGKTAVSTEDGERVFETINTFLEKDVEVILDFTNIDMMIATFLNAAIGQLYKSYDSPFLKEHLTVFGLQPEDRERMIKTIERAKEYFENKENLEKDIGEAFDDE